jgi:hypothetical protein
LEDPPRYCPGPGPVSTDRVFGRNELPNENPDPFLRTGSYPPGPGYPCTSRCTVKSLRFPLPTLYAGDHFATISFTQLYAPGPGPYRMCFGTIIDRLGFIVVVMLESSELFSAYVPGPGCGLYLWRANFFYSEPNPNWGPSAGFFRSSYYPGPGLSSILASIRVELPN